MNKCLNCGKPVHNKFCNVSCQNQYRALIKRKEYDSNPKKCLNCGKILDWEHRYCKFCNSSCAATYNNVLRGPVSDEQKRKTSNTLKSKYVPSKHVPSKHNCKVCGKCYEYIKGKNTETFCSSECKAYYNTHRNEFLSEESKLKISQGGRKSSKVQGDSRRSKNEIYFHSLCIEKFDKVLNNEGMFNGWDADVIIEDYKIAILWNGPWHYRKITKKHSVKQVQNRDKIKITEIKNKGYIPYIIKDMGKYDKCFVESQFEKLLEYIINIQCRNEGSIPTPATK